MPFEPCPRRRAVGRQALHQAPKARPVVHFGEMRHFVGDDIVDDRFGRKDEPPAEREISPAGAAPPSALRITHTDPRQLASDACCEGTRPAGELDARHSDEVITHTALEVRGIAAHPDLAVTDRHWRRCWVVLAPDAMGDAEHRYNDPLSEPHRLREGREASGDPSLLSGEKPQTMTRRHAGRQNQLDFAFGRIDSQRDPPRPPTDPDRYASVGIVRCYRLPSGIFQWQCPTQPAVNYEPSMATGRREVRAIGGVEARVLVFTIFTREGSRCRIGFITGFPGR